MQAADDIGGQIAWRRIHGGILTQRRKEAKPQPKKMEDCPPCSTKWLRKKLD
jgi:hypothetical protein